MNKIELNLFSAVKSGSKDSLESILSEPTNGIDINIKDASEKTLLHYAVEFGHPDILKILLSQKNIDPFIPNGNGQTAYALAHSEGVGLSGERTSAKPESEKELNPAFSSAWKACQFSSPEHAGKYQKLAEKVRNGSSLSELDLSDFNLNYQGHDNSQTLMHIAVQANNRPVVYLLLDKKANAGIVDSNGDTPMCVAANNGNLELIDRLSFFKTGCYSLGKALWYIGSSSKNIVEFSTTMYEEIMTLADKLWELSNEEDRSYFKDNYANDALRIAIERNNTYRVFWLILHGADQGNIFKDPKDPIPAIPDDYTTISLTRAYTHP